MPRTALITAASTKLTVGLLAWASSARVPPRPPLASPDESAARGRTYCALGESRRPLNCQLQATGAILAHAAYVTGAADACAVRLAVCKMPARARLKPLNLTRDEQEQLELWARDCQGSRRLAMRARIVLSCQASYANQESAKRLNVTAQTVGKWRARFVAHGMRGLVDRPRSGAPRSISDALVEAVLAKTLHEEPPGGVRWSSRRLAVALGVSQRTILRIWHTFDL
jgi:transposase